jgi:hypothetical protein
MKKIFFCMILMFYVFIRAYADISNVSSLSNTAVAVSLSNTFNASAIPSGIQSLTKTAGALISPDLRIAPAANTANASASGVTYEAKNQLLSNTINVNSSFSTGTGASITASATNLTITADASASTIPAVVDLSPASINFMPDAAIGIKLYWYPKQNAPVYYNVYRADTGEFAKINKEKSLKSEYVDADIATSTVYFYKVEATDLSGNAYMSKSQTVKSADFMPSYVPQGLKAFQDIQSVSLKWAQSNRGSYEVSGYNFYRGKTPEENKFIKFVPYSKVYYTDEEVEPGIRYYYKMTSIDIKGNESKKSDAASAVPFPQPRTNVCLLPTGYRNNIYDNFGFNLDMGFTYYIGTIFGEHNTTLLGKGDDTFRKNGVWLLSLNAKWTFFNENAGWYPSLGLGLMYSILLQDSIGGSTQNYGTGGGTSFGTKDQVLTQQGLFFVATKKVGWDVTLDAGYIQGFRLYKGDKGKGTSGYLTYIVSSILGGNNVESTGSKTSDTGAEVRNSYYLGFARDIFKKVGLKVELTVPFEFNSNPFLPNVYIINTHIDRLFNFDIAYMHYDGGYAWLGYYNLQFSIFPSPYK